MTHEAEPATDNIMKLKDVICSGLAFKRKSDDSWMYNLGGSIRMCGSNAPVNLDREDVDANDWTTREPWVTLTVSSYKEAFKEAMNRCPDCFRDESSRALFYNLLMESMKFHK